MDGLCSGRSCAGNLADTPLMPEGRTCVGVVFGGPSAEHEVSAASALAVIRGLRATRFRPVAIGIGRDGCWRLPPARAVEEAMAAPAAGRGRGGAGPRGPAAARGGPGALPP